MTTPKPELISHAEAKQIMQRMINSHFNNEGEQMRASIPADPSRDDDLRMLAYIEQQSADEALIAQLVGALKKAKPYLSHPAQVHDRYSCDTDTCPAHTADTALAAAKKYMEGI